MCFLCEFKKLQDLSHTAYNFIYDHNVYAALILYNLLFSFVILLLEIRREETRLDTVTLDILDCRFLKTFTFLDGDCTFWSDPKVHLGYQIS